MELFLKSREEFIKLTGNKSPQKYVCNECGCIFWGRWHSEYSFDKIVCPVCLDDTDTFFIDYAQ